MLSAYQIDGLAIAKPRKMFLCNNVKFTCCTKIDELQYHNHWNTYYQPKISRIFQTIGKKIGEFSEIFEYFRNYELS